MCGKPRGARATVAGEATKDRASLNFRSIEPGAEGADRAGERIFPEGESNLSSALKSKHDTFVGPFQIFEVESYEFGAWQRRSKADKQNRFISESHECLGAERKHSLQIFDHERLFSGRRCRMFTPKSANGVSHNPLVGRGRQAVAAMHFGNRPEPSLYGRYFKTQLFDADTQIERDIVRLAGKRRATVRLAPGTKVTPIRGGCALRILCAVARCERISW
jgi:hypothetical protein